MTTKKKYYLLIIIGFIHLIYCENSELDYNESSDRDIRHVSSNDSEYYLKFTKKLTNYSKLVAKSLTFKCQVVLSNYYADLMNSTLRYEDIQNITENVLHKVKIRWLKNNSPIVFNKRITKKKIVENGTVSSYLRFRNLEMVDKSSYSCIAAIGKNEIQSDGYLDILENLEDEDKTIPPYKPLFTNMETNQEPTFPSGVTGVFSGFEFTKQHNLTSHAIDEDNSDEAMTKILNIDTYSSKQATISYPPQGICQPYTGLTCAQFLYQEYVFIPYPATQAAFEEKLSMAFKVVTYSNEISSSCRRYALPSLCFSTFPICQFPNETNTLFFQHFEELNESQNKIKKTYPTIEQDDDSVLKINFENLPPSGLPPHLSPAKPTLSLSNRNYDTSFRGKRHAFPELEMHIDTRTKKTVLHEVKFENPQDPPKKFTVSRSTIPLRRVCREDCNHLENELCQKEYAIAKRHPEIGQKLTLEKCEDLPHDSKDCLKIEIDKEISSETCYWEKGIRFRGNISISKSGQECIKWSDQFILKMDIHPELSGGHNYCRNPGGKESQPWCYVTGKDNIQEQLCDIPKCSKKIWMYIIFSMVAVSSIIFFCLIFICCRQRNSKHNTAAIRNINLPNADKNIYGNSRLNSPIELNELLAGQNPNSRSNGILRVPQFTLSQIKFVEELGEGAFGKVYKGELSKDNEKIFVAVKALKENASHKTQQDFKREIELISELRHENIVCILGVVLREEPLCMLFEFMAKGDLHEFLMEQAPPMGSGLSPTQFLLIAKHIASGMEYLAAHHYVHRDLAARNCLVADNLIVKISDFGLSRDIYSSDYYRVQSKSLLPVRWMPPESILYGKFTTESDVWSYGVVLWEIYSYGLQPYYGHSNQEVISFVRGRHLLQTPTDCPPNVMALMRECWHQTPSKRPNFTLITQRLSGWLRPNGGLYSDMTSDSSSSQRVALCPGDPRERVPLIGAHSSSNGSLSTLPRKLSIAGSVRSHTSARLMMSSSDVTSSSDNCESNVKLKKSSCGSLLESGDRGQKDTIVKIPTLSQPYDI